MDIRTKQPNVITFRIDDKTLDFLESQAELFNTSRSEIIKVAINNYRLNYANKNNKGK